MKALKIVGQILGFGFLVLMGASTFSYLCGSRWLGDVVMAPVLRFVIVGALVAVAFGVALGLLFSPLIYWLVERAASKRRDKGED